MEDKRTGLRLAEEYLQSLETAERPPEGNRIIGEERLILPRLITHLGATRIDQVTPEQIAAYRSARLLDGLALRTINLHITVLRYVYARAVEEGILVEVPRFKRFGNSECGIQVVRVCRMPNLQSFVTLPSQGPELFNSKATRNPKSRASQF